MKKPDQSAKSEPNNSKFFGKSTPKKPEGSKDASTSSKKHESKSMPVISEPTESPLKFVPDENDSEVCNVFFEDEHLGNIGSNMCGIISVYYDMYHSTQLCLKQHSPHELDKEYSLKDLQGLIKEQHKLAIDLTIYQMGKKVFNGFKELVKEQDTMKRIVVMTPRVLKIVTQHRDILTSKPVKVTQHNTKILEILAQTLNNISKQLDDFKLSSYQAKIPGASKIVASIVKAQSQNAKSAASAFDEASKSFKGKDCVVKIATVKDVEMKDLEAAKAERKGQKVKEKGAQDDKKEEKKAPQKDAKKTSAVEPASEKKPEEKEASSSEEKGFW